MGCGGKMSEKIKIGSIIYYTKTPIAFLMKPENAGDLWKIGLLVDYKGSGLCTIINSSGDYQICHHTMIMQYPRIST